MPQTRSSFLTGVLLLAFVSSAQASMITFEEGDAASIEYNGMIDGEEQPGLSARTDLLFASASEDENALYFDIELENTSDDDIWDRSRLSGFGFTADPAVDKVAISGGPDASDWTATEDKQLPGLFDVDICLASSESGNVCGTGGGGLEIDESAAFTLKMTFDSDNGAPDALDLTEFGVRWQSLDSEHLELKGESGVGTPTTQVPEPGMLALLGVGLVAVGLASFRRRRA